MKNLSFKVIIFISLIYFITHLYHLTALPVFADEAIYIRWSQLIIDDWQRYLFFPLNDGKTPLQMWLMLPFQFIFNDQLYAGRFLSVLIGFFQLLVINEITKKLGGQKKAQFLALLMTVLLPFWFFHHRMALIDALLTFFLSLTCLYLIKVAQTIDLPNLNIKLNKKTILKFCLYNQPFNDTLLAGVAFGLALLSKITAILFIPIFFLIIFLAKEKKIQAKIILLSYYSMSMLLGLFIFILLKLHPAFGQLFARGNDFLFPINEVLFQGVFRTTLSQIPKYFLTWTNYLGWPVIILNLVSLFYGQKNRLKITRALISYALILSLPIFILGKVVYPRYFLPVAIFLTINVALFLEEIYPHLIIIQNFFSRQIKSLTKVNLKTAKQLSQKILMILLTIVVNWPAWFFIYTSYFQINKIPFVKSDQAQYLYEWSAGFGVKEAVELIKDIAKSKKVIVATEGYFGTLPDGILMYLHRRDVSNIAVEGIGQPIHGIPSKFKIKAQNYDQALLVVNSYRLDMSLDQQNLIQEVCRPNQSPCQQVWDISDVVTSY